MQGKAIDICLPVVPLDVLRKSAIAFNAGLVGYYPASNFIHLDIAAATCLADQKIPHHPHILMLKIMAMVKIKPGVIIERLENCHFLAWHN